MSGPKPNPTLNAEGLPLCSEDACALYDGKRCRAIGFRPGTYCEPALVELVAKAKGAAGGPKSRRDRLLAEREGLACANAELGATLVDLRRSLAELESVRTEQAEKLRRHLDELAAARARIEEYEALLLACPMGHHDGKIIWYRSTTEADLVAWVDRVHVEGRAGHAATLERAASVTTTIEQAPPDDLLDQTRCPHRRVSLRPDAHGNPETTCLDCGEPTNP